MTTVTASAISRILNKESSGTSFGYQAREVNRGRVRVDVIDYGDSSKIYGQHGALARAKAVLDSKGYVSTVTNFDCVLVTAKRRGY